MKVAVVGAGAMGSLFGALLTEAGEEVWLIDIWQEHIERVNSQGLSVESKGSERIVKLRATMDPADATGAQLVVIFVKSTQTAAAAATAAHLVADNGSVLTLQNGMGNAETLAETIQPSQIKVGTTSHGATLLGPGSIRHAGQGPTTIGQWGGGSDSYRQTEQIAQTLSDAGITTELVEDVVPVLWGKLIVNIGINAITALTGIKNGQILDHKISRDLSRAAVEEAMAVARVKNIPIRKDFVDHVFEVAQATSANRSSMGQDVDRRRLTEIGAINGYVVREAEHSGIKAPVNKTLTSLIRTLESQF